MAGSRFSAITLSQAAFRAEYEPCLCRKPENEFFEIASKDHIYPKVPMSAKLYLVVAFYASTLTKKALDI
jgi:hypothetical protein